MSRDRRRTLEIHPGMPDTPAIDALSDGAFRLLISALCYAIRQEAGMVIPAQNLSRIVPRYRAKQVGELVAAGLWQANTAGDYVINLPGSRTYSDGHAAWRERQAPVSRAAIPADLRTLVYTRDGRSCQVCGTTEHLTLDHIHPKSLGGQDVLENLQTLCRPCNSRKGARIQ